MADPMTTIDTSPEALERLAEEFLGCNLKPHEWGALNNCATRVYAALRAIAAEKRLPKPLRAADGSVSRLPEINAALGEIERERAAFRAGAKAMQEAAAKVIDAEINGLEKLIMLQYQQGRHDHATENRTEAGRLKRHATAIRAIDPAALTGRPVAPVVDGAMVQRAMDTFGMPPSFKAMRRALEAALKGEK